MVLFILTRDGYHDVQSLVTPTGGPVWVNADVLSPDEVDSLRGAGLDLTQFSTTIDPADFRDIEAALSTIAEHHPGERIFVELRLDSPW